MRSRGALRTKPGKLTGNPSRPMLQKGCQDIDSTFHLRLTPQSTESPASLDRPIGAIFECLIGSKRPVYTSQLQYSVKVATSSYTVQSNYMLVYPGSYMYLDVPPWIYKHILHVATCRCLA